MSKHQPVNLSLADGCVKHYHEVFKGAIDPKIVEAFTADVVFDKAQLIAWLNTITTDSVKISLGIYTPEFVAQYPTAKPKRLTTFIYPYNTPAAGIKAQGAGDPPADEDPFNLGNLNP